MKQIVHEAMTTIPPVGTQTVRILGDDDKSIVTTTTTAAVC